MKSTGLVTQRLASHNVGLEWLEFKDGHSPGHRQGHRFCKICSGISWQALSGAVRHRPNNKLSHANCKGQWMLIFFRHVESIDIYIYEDIGSTWLFWGSFHGSEEQRNPSRSLEMEAVSASPCYKVSIHFLTFLLYIYAQSTRALCTYH